MGMEGEEQEKAEKVVPLVVQDADDELELIKKKYLRGDRANLEALKDKKLRGQLAHREEVYGKSATAAAKAEKWLMPNEQGYLETEGLEKTWRIKQESIVREVDILSSKKAFDLVLPELGPYTLDYTSSGRYMAVGGRKGHLAIVDMNNMSLVKEFQVRETVRDVAFLHNELFFAAAQKKFRSKELMSKSLDSILGILRGRSFSSILISFVDATCEIGDTMLEVGDVTFGVEDTILEVRDSSFKVEGIHIFITGMVQNFTASRLASFFHVMKEHGAALKLKFLKNHFLLASVNKFGQLHYQDVTMGGMVGNYRTGLGRCDVMDVNPFNAVVGLGHSCGKVTMWTPTNPSPLVKMLCHHGPVLAVAFHPGGQQMATAGRERKIKIWDLRKYEVLHTYSTGARTLQFSQKGLLSIGNGSHVEVWRDSSGNHDYRPYMNHSMVKGYQIEKVAFRPYEDVLALGHSMGFSCTLVPGSGEPNFDSWVANPFETAKQRREKEIHSLLDKLQPETIVLDPTNIGGLRPWRRKERPAQHEREAELEAAIEAAKNAPTKHKTKGRSKPSKLERKKKDSIVRAKRPFVDQQKKEEDQLLKKKQRISEEAQLPVSLQRFARKKAK
ncbi:hypothetical protein GIB67_005827 [Kingdonia uniflora]|uniref:BING4 C-terminal domain-containing protein n=1 Tax=Kingdonia uniflora TaxID=39325 RepID=A0A7J7LUC2_9MAGN|nr:hypothetical protein GIB67_005827 [Kingdonia uniflora]